jgi:hypothetical protein
MGSKTQMAQSEMLHLPNRDAVGLSSRGGATPRSIPLISFRSTPILSFRSNKTPRSQANIKRSSGLTNRFLSQEYFEEAASKFSDYDPSAWRPTLQARMTPFMYYPWVCITVWVSLLTWIVEIHKEFMTEFSLSTDAHIVMGSALSFLIVFRTNASYDRWWEARCAWQTVVSTCRTLSTMSVPALVDDEARELLTMQIVAFCLAMKSWLREEPISDEELGPRMDQELMQRLNRSVCAPMMAIRIMAQTVRTKLPHDDPDTVFDEASLGAAIYEEAADLLRVLSVQVA